MQLRFMFFHSFYYWALKFFSERKNWLWLDHLKSFIFWCSSAIIKPFCFEDGLSVVINDQDLKIERRRKSDYHQLEGNWTQYFSQITGKNMSFTHNYEQCTFFSILPGLFQVKSLFLGRTISWYCCPYLHHFCVMLITWNVPKITCVTANFIVLLAE